MVYSGRNREIENAPILNQFPILPPRDDMQNYFCLSESGTAPVLRMYYGGDNSVIVAEESPVYWHVSNKVKDRRSPDLLIAFSVDYQMLVAQMGYSIADQGKPPDFVLEIASKSTGNVDTDIKPYNYAAFGIPEYWRFDSSGGKYHGQHLAGDRLVDGVYQPLDIHHKGVGHIHGYSNVLKLELCWEYNSATERGMLKWWDPRDQCYLPTVDDLVEGRIAAEARADSAESRAATAEAENAKLREIVARLKAQG